MPADGNIDVLLALPAHLATVEQYEALVTSPRISDAFRAGIKRKLARYYRERAEAQDRSGTRWSGMDTEGFKLPPLAELQKEEEARQAALNSPRGRFLAALSGAEEIDPSRVSDIRALYSRDLADDRAPLNTAAVGAALVLLNDVPGKHARTAIDCLAELLMNERRA